MTFHIKNWAQFQHYKHRNPPWIKFHRSLLDDPEWHALDGDASKMLAMCWLIASECDGELPALSKLAFRLRTTEENILHQFSKLSHWVEQDASVMLAPRLRDATTETETETEKSREDNSLRSVAVSRETESKGLSGKEYSFESGVIRLNEKDFKKWETSFPNLDLKAELISLTQWANEHGDQWYFPVAGALAKRNREQKVKLEHARVGGSERHSLADPLAGIV